MDEQRKTAGIVLAVADERAGNASSHDEGRPGRGAYPPGAQKQTPRAVGVVPRENFLNFEWMGRGVVRLVLSLFLAPKTSPATWENLCSAKNCSGLSVEILNILNSPKKGADSDLCARSARTREEETGLTCGGSFVAMACARGIPEFRDLSARTRERKTGLA